METIFNPLVTKTIFNVSIHEDGLFDKQLFLEKTECVSALRENQSAKLFTFSPASEYELSLNYATWRLVRGSFGKLGKLRDDTKYFAVTLPEWLFVFLSEIKKYEMERYAAFFLASIYIDVDVDRNYIKRDVLPKVHQRMLFYAHKILLRYQEIVVRDYDMQGQYNEGKKYKRRAPFKLMNKAVKEIYIETFGTDKYFDVFINYPAGNSPFNGPSDGDIYGTTSYLNKEDWDAILLENIKDDMHRAESNCTVWEKWKLEFSK